MHKTALYDLHNIAKARIVDFAGYQMPLYYDMGIVKEHLWVRKSCGIFDVSHMGQVIISGANIEEFLSYISPTNFRGNDLYKSKYTTLLNEKCGVIDDIIASKLSTEKYHIVLNAARKEIDIAWLIKQSKNFLCQVESKNNLSLIAVQGKYSARILAEILGNEVNKMPYMSVKEFSFKGVDILLSRTGYTGEDGFEVSLANELAANFWQILLAYKEVKPIGLGARDSLRLEMGYPLYGHELREDINLGESSLRWIISSNDNFIGKSSLNNSPRIKRVGVKLLDKGIAREEMLVKNEQGEDIGILTSAGYSPSLDCSIGQARINIEYAKVDTEVFIEVRGKFKRAKITNIAFLQNKTKKTF
jgi:aminomethyltransferase